MRIIVRECSYLENKITVMEISKITYIPNGYEHYISNANIPHYYSRAFLISDLQNNKYIIKCNATNLKKHSDNIDLLCTIAKEDFIDLSNPNDFCFIQDEQMYINYIMDTYEYITK